MKKGVIKVLLPALAVLTVAAGLNFAEAQDTVLFNDVSEGSRYFTAIRHLKENGLVIGYEDGSFKPLQEINRAEALKVLQLALKTKGSSVLPLAQDKEATADAADPSADEREFGFDDVPEDAWYYPFVLEAWQAGVVQGYPDGLFHPERTINTAESLKIVIEQEGLPLPEGIEKPPYGDVPTDAWFSPYAQVSKEKTLIVESRDGGKLFPGKNMNRGDFAELIYHLIRNREGALFTRATWYSDSLSMQSTANRELYIPTKMTAAHKTLPFNTAVRVTNLANGKVVEVRINDRGPYATGVGLDLSRSAFETIASAGTGIIFVEYEVIGTETAEEWDAADPNDIEYGF